MSGIVNDRDLVIVEPLATKIPMRGDIVLCKVGSYEYLHRVVAVEMDRFQIGNARGRVNGWIRIDKIYGICTSINGNPTSAGKRLQLHQGTQT